MESIPKLGARPVFYEVSQRWMPLMVEFGLNLFKIGEEAVVDLAAFSLDGPARKKLRAVHVRAGRDGLTLDIVSPPHDSDLIVRLRTISDIWLEDQNTREKRFSVGRFDEIWLDRFDLAIVRHEGKVVSFANIFRGGNGRRASIALMRHAGDAPKGVMEFLFTELMLRLKAEGGAEFSLGMAPLSGIEGGEGARLWHRLGAAAFRHGRSFYNFEGLHAFEDKFDPEWRLRCVAAPSTVAPILPLADASLLIAGGAKGLVRT